MSVSFSFLYISPSWGSLRPAPVWTAYCPRLVLPWAGPSSLPRPDAHRALRGGEGLRVGARSLVPPFFQYPVSVLSCVCRRQPWTPSASFPGTVFSVVPLIGKAGQRLGARKATWVSNCFVN